MPPKIAGLQFAPGGRTPVKVKPKPAPVLGPPAPVKGPPTPSSSDRALIETFEAQPKHVKERVVRNARKRRTRESQVLLQHLGLTGESPFAKALKQGGEKLQSTVNDLPNPPRLLQVPDVGPFSRSQRDYILGEQGPRLSALAKSTGLTGDQLQYALPGEDAGQVGLFSQLAGQRQRSTARTVGDVRKDRVLPGPEKTLKGSALGLGAAVISPENNLFAAMAPGVKALAGPVASDAVHLIPDSALSMYALGDAGVQAAQGNLEPAKRIGQGLTQGVIGNAVRGDWDAVAKYTQEHPLYAILELSGAESAIGRGAGATLRSGALGPKLKAAAGTKRAPITDVYGRTLQERSYSKDLLRKAGQVAYDKTRLRDGVPKSVGARERLSRASVDEFAGMQENLRRIGRQEATKRMTLAIPTRGSNAATRAADRLAPARMRPERDILQAVVEGRVDPQNLAKTLRAERARLATAYNANRDRMTAAQRMANQKQVRAIDRVLKDPKALANVSGIERAAASFKSAADATEARAISLGLLDSDQALTAKLRPYAVAKMDARWNGNGLVDPDGAPLRNAAVIAHMEATGVKMPAFVSHKLDTTGARAFMVNWFDRRRTLDAKSRTGRATELGAHASDFPAMAQQHIHTQGVVDAVGGFDEFVHQYGLKHSSGRMFTWDEASKLAEDPTPIAGLDSRGNPIPGHEPLVPVRVVPARYSQQTREAVAGMQDATRLPETGHLVEERIRQAQLPPDDAVGPKTPNTVLVPASEMKRFSEHQQRYSNTGAKLAQVATNAFRSAVLPFSTKWVAGNVVEASLRLALTGATPRDVRIGQRLVKALEAQDAQAAKQFRARTQGGLMFGGSQKLAIRRDAESFKGTALEKPAAVAGTLRRTPVVKQTADAIMGLGRAVFALNRAFEQGAQYAAVGKFARRQMQEVSGSWLKSVKAAQPALGDLAKGLTETPAQVRYARYIDETLGKYSRFSPTERRLFQTIAPFAPWYLNSLRFVLWTLPVKHPVKQAVIASVANTFQKDWEAQHKNLPPGGLRHGVVRKDGGVVDISRFTPFGLFNQPELPVLPQLSGIASAIAGKSWTGNDLRTSHGEANAGDRILIALNSLAESMTPGLALGRRLREGGYTSFDNSTIFAPKTKPGTKHGSAANRVFNPFRPTYLKKTGDSGIGGVRVPSVKVPSVKVPSVSVR